ncbi:hypothetical protein [Streptomyces sp. NPDC051014]|uniref:hypothetical protein n=1 Tax=Streptomyces sp. NPDC051014 TaxID=3155751 RepID=UPI0033F1FDE5
MDNTLNRFFVLAGAEIPLEVKAELEAFRFDDVSATPGARDLIGDFVIAVLGGLASAGIWDYLPVWAVWLTGAGARVRRADATRVTANAVALCVQVGLAREGSDVVVERLEKVTQAGWSGRALIGTTAVSFRTDGRGEIIVFDTVSPGAATQ